MSGARALAAQAQTLLFIILLSNAGGAGKTTLARILISIFKFAMKDPAIFECDQGNRVLSRYYPKAIPLGWGIRPEEGIAEMAKCEGQHIILDVGANTLASMREIVGTIDAMIGEARRKGYHCVALLPLEPDKRGSAEMLIQLADNLPACEKIVVHNDKDGSGEFEKSKHNYPVANLGYLAPGYMKWVGTFDEGSFTTAIVARPDDRIRASLHVAKWIRDFVVQLPSHHVFEKVLRTLKTFEAPKPNCFRPLDVSATADTCLEEWEEITIILQLLRKHGRSPEGLRRAADELEHNSSQA